MNREGQAFRLAVFLSWILGSTVFLQGCASLLLNKGFPQQAGEIQRVPLHGPVEVIRDPSGIPHIYAQDEHDLMVAQGFVHAQDRLWQMEVTRRLAQGRLSEIAGEETLMVDYFVRLLGLPELRSRAAQALSSEDLDRMQAYLAGINAYLELQGEDLPLEFRSLGLKPEPWTLEDLFSSLALTAWFLQTNYKQELLTIKAASKMERQGWEDLFPSHPGALLPSEEYFDSIRHLKIGPLHPSALVFHWNLPASPSPAASNNWVVARSEDGKPLLANDPHLAVTVPGIWYFCHLYAPGFHVAGASMAGTPGIVIGHNDFIAWGLTNLMTDCADLFVLQVDPDHPTRYRVADRTLKMEREEVLFRLPKGRSKKMTIFRTIYGPVITRIQKGAEAAVALKWYGTLARGDLEDHSVRAFLSLARARSVEEALEAGKGIAFGGQNLLAADREGHIGWHATGAVPVRRGYSGRLPAEGSSGIMDWTGFLSYSDLPARLDPPEGWIATANQRVVSDQDAQPISFAWTSPYRHQRITQLLQDLATPSSEDFRRIQMDVHSLQAERILSPILSFSFQDEKAKAAVEILRGWDRKVKSESPGAALYEVFVTQWVKTLLEDELGEDLPLYFNLTEFYSIQDVLLDRPGSPLWDRIDTPEKEGPREILEISLARAMEWLEKKLGPNVKKWTWGRLHMVYFQHPGGKGGLSACLLNRGPFPAPGDCQTVNVAGFVPAQGGYEVLWIPSLRMIVPLGNLDETRIMGTTGQSGQPGHPHYDDMIEPWIKGEMAILPFSREAVEKAAASRLLLKP
ncbi:MAG: penicillin acylase family protein [candidate division NC10 bacterium]|nr:penicillin acylase family protein [candidate division NC10 bacterium]